MEERRTQIDLAVEKLIRRQRWYDFELLAFQLARQRWPDLEPTEWWRDGGEDGITMPLLCSDGLRRSLACSLSGTLDKIRQDCKRIAGRKVLIDVLIFYTPSAVPYLEIIKWQDKIRKEFGHDLHVMPRASVIADLERPDNAWLCREYLELNFADEPDIESLATKVCAAATTALQQGNYYPNRNNSAECYRKLQQGS